MPNNGEVASSETRVKYPADGGMNSMERHPPAIVAIGQIAIGAVGIAERRTLKNKQLGQEVRAECGQKFLQ